MKNEFINQNDNSIELEESYLLNTSSKLNKEKSKGGLAYLQGIIDKEGLRSFQYLSGFALGLAFLLYGILSYEFNFIYPALNKALNLSGTQKEMINLSFSIGDIIGAFISQYLSKYFGRRNSILTASAVLLVTSCAVSIFTDVIWLCLCRFISGVSIAINFCLIITSVTEFLPSYAREIMTISFISFFRLGIIFYVLVDRIFNFPRDNMIDYFNKKNDDFKHAVYLPAMISIFLFIFNTFAVKETPRYLFLNDKYIEGKEIIKEVYKKQALSLDYNILIREAEDFAEESRSQNSFIDLFSERYLRLTLLTCFILVFSHICNTSNIYCLPLILNFDISNFWEYIILQQAVALIAHGPAVYLSHNVHIGRKYTILIGFSGVAIISLTTLAFSDGILISSPFMNLFITFFMSVTKLYIAEAFPTKLRNAAISLSYSTARVGDFLSFILCDLTHSLFNYGPMLVIFIASLIGGTCTFLLRVETSNISLDRKNS